MKKIIIIIAAIPLAFAMVSCSKEISSCENKGKSVIFANTEDSISKTALLGSDDEGYQVVWSEGDSFMIGGNIFSLSDGENTTVGKFEGEVPADGEYTVYYPSSYDGTVWPAAQTYVEGNIAGSPMKATVAVTDGQAPSSIQFKNEGGIFRITVKASDDVTISNVAVNAKELVNPISLDCEDGVTIGSDVEKVFHIAMPVGEYTEVSIVLTDSEGNECTKNLKSTKSLIIEFSKITPASFTAVFTAPESDDALSGEFHVSSSKIVQFAKGNLIVDGGEYSFAASQTEPGSLFASVNTEYTVSGTQWILLSAKEWNYLINNHDRIIVVENNAVIGFAVMPDSFYGNVYGKDWAALEADGAILLPASGYAYESGTVSGIGEGGSYWTSDSKSLDFDCLSFYPDDVTPAGIMQSVRLVKIVENK